MFNKSLAVAVLLGAIATQAPAATVNCPGTAITTDREFSVTTDPASTCVAFGNGPEGTPSTQALIASYIGGSVKLDKTDSVGTSGVVIDATGISALSGTFSISGIPVGFSLTNVFLAFQSGVAQLNPDWALFKLADGVVSGTWKILNGSQSLSHISLYGTLTKLPPPPPVPLPAAGLMLVGGLGALGALRRKRRAV